MSQIIKSYLFPRRIMNPRRNTKEYKCSFRYCLTTSETEGRHLFCYPYRDKNRSTLWAQASENPEIIQLCEGPEVAKVLNHRRVCDLHFPPVCFMDPGRTKLSRIAVPVKFESINPKDVYEELEKLRNKVKYLERELKTIKSRCTCMSDQNWKNEEIKEKLLNKLLNNPIPASVKEPSKPTQPPRKRIKTVTFKKLMVYKHSKDFHQAVKMVNEIKPHPKHHEVLFKV